MAVARDDIERLLIREGITCFFRFRDATYSLLKPEWVYGKFARAWQQEMVRRGLLRYESDANDCDDYSAHCISFLSELHLKTPKRRPKSASCFGHCDYLRDYNGAMHRVNLFPWRDEETGELRLSFFSPQTAAEWHLSKLEKENVCDGEF